MGKETLVLTVGQGDLDKLESSLFVPLRKSIAKGEWERVVLIPSQATEPLARQLAGDDSVYQVAALGKAGMEDDADLCFAHCDGVIGRLLEAGVDRQAITIDFTRGTKAMSAAAVLAAVARDVRKLRYVTGKRSRGGIVIAGAEEIRDVSTRIASTRRALELAERFLETYEFAAAGALFPEGGSRWLLGYPEPCRADVEWTRWIAEFWGAWDRFDYRAARDCVGRMPGSGSTQLARWIPTGEQRKFVTRLAAGPSGAGTRGNMARDLAADMLSSAGRRLGTGAYEDALLRNYRALEMIGQARLFDRGLDSEDLDCGHPGIQGWLASGKAPRQRGKRMSLDRGQAVSLLDWLRDPLAKRLESGARSGPHERNQSVLIHGLDARGDKRRETRVHAELCELFREEHPKNGGRLAAAAFPAGGKAL